mmetsp:Transcript_1698/g.4309  ORF Transcript_1698/g.4309 Transcript_1698/m.4309 type:complete len:219 (+) Transcript_1698:224-880(+)
MAKLKAKAQPMLCAPLVGKVIQSLVRDLPVEDATPPEGQAEEAHQRNAQHRAAGDHQHGLDVVLLTDSHSHRCSGDDACDEEHKAWDVLLCAAQRVGLVFKEVQLLPQLVNVLAKHHQLLLAQPCSIQAFRNLAIAHNVVAVFRPLVRVINSTRQVQGDPDLPKHRFVVRRVGIGLEVGGRQPLGVLPLCGLADLVRPLLNVARRQVRLVPQHHREAS